MTVDATADVLMRAERVLETGEGLSEPECGLGRKAEAAVGFALQTGEVVEQG